MGPHGIPVRQVRPIRSTCGKAESQNQKMEVPGVHCHLTLRGIIIPILQTRKQKVRENKSVAQDHVAQDWQNGGPHVDLPQ